MLKKVALAMLLVATLKVVDAENTHALTFTVTTTASSGAGSLRQAILDANGNAGADLIGFNIPADDPGCNEVTGVCTISPLFMLPTITSPVTIDGYTQPGATPNTLTNGNDAKLLIELSWPAPGLSIGLYFTTGGNTVRGLVVNRFIGAGLEFSNSNNNLIEGNFIGTDPTGTIDRGNSQAGIGLGASSDNRIGGTNPAARNVISGNGGGIGIGGGGGANIIQGNFIGTDSSGTKPLENSSGIGISNSHFNLIGGTDQGARNIVSGNTFNGVNLTYPTSGNVIQGNYIGTDVSGSKRLSNGFAGIQLMGDTTIANVTIGGAAANAGNVISGNGRGGIEIWGGRDHLVLGNYVGTQADGVSALGNGSSGGGAGIWLANSLSGDHRIGGTLQGEGNVIAYNNGPGVAVEQAIGAATISGNSIYANQRLGIDLGLFGYYGVTPNDAGDGDSGPNGLQNFPVISSVTSTGGVTTINGSLNSVANAPYRMEFFYSLDCDLSGHGEGQTFMGHLDVNTDVAGNASFAVAFPTPLPLGSRVSATATSSSGYTSEFSRAIAHPLPDPDIDCDRFVNELELACGSDPLNFSSLPERVDGPYMIDEDGDHSFDEPLPPGAAAYDCDGDGYTGSVEASVFAGGGNGDQDPCGGNGWPSELNSEGASANKLDMADLGTFVAPVRRLGTDPGHENFGTRWDLVPGSIIGAAINVADLAALVAGASGYPPMFGGLLRAYGNTCPYAP